MNEDFESVMSDETKYKILRQLARLMALKWTADQGRPVPPWRDSIDSDGWFDEDLLEILTLWFPDLTVITEWTALPASIQAQIREMTGTALDREPDNFFILYWPWADDPDHAELLATLWTTRLSTMSQVVNLYPPYIYLFTEDLVAGEETSLELAHQCQALRAALEPWGYHDPEEASV